MGLARVYSNTNRRGNSVIKGLYELSSLENHTGVSDGTSTMCMCVCAHVFVCACTCETCQEQICQDIFLCFLSIFLFETRSLTGPGHCHFG